MSAQCQTTAPECRSITIKYLVFAQIEETNIFCCPVDLGPGGGIRFVHQNSRGSSFLNIACKVIHLDANLFTCWKSKLDCPVSKDFIGACSSQAGDIYWSWKIIFLFFSLFSILVIICNAIVGTITSMSFIFVQANFLFSIFIWKTHFDFHSGALPGVLGQPAGLRDCLRIPPCLSPCRQIHLSHQVPLYLWKHFHCFYSYKVSTFVLCLNFYFHLHFNLNFSDAPFTPSLALVADVARKVRSWKEGPPAYAILSRNLVLSRFRRFLKGFHRAFN